MRKQWIVPFFLFLLLVGCKKAEPEAAVEAEYRILTDYEELGALLEELPEDAVLLDLRDNEEYEKAHLVGSINVPYDDEGVWLRKCIEEKGWSKKTIYLMCGGGKRSADAFNQLVEGGMPQVVYIRFGYSEYIESQGYETSEGAEVCDCYQKKSTETKDVE